MIRQLTQGDLETLGVLPLIPIIARSEHQDEDLQTDLMEIGSGSNARVFEHPSDPAKVIRICVLTDGWIPYAIRTNGMRFSPGVEALGFQEGVWIAITDRLSPSPEFPRDPLPIIHLAASASPDQEDFSSEDGAFPGLCAFVRDHLVGADDVRPPNLRYRGEQLIINDPYSCADGEIFDLVRQWEVPAAPLSVHELQLWGHGQCHVLTIALAEATGWDIITLHDGRIRCNQSYLHDFGEPLHSGILTPDGRFLDAYGIHDGDWGEMIKERYAISPETADWRPDAAAGPEHIREILVPGTEAAFMTAARKVARRIVWDKRELFIEPQNSDDIRP